MAKRGGAKKKTKTSCAKGNTVVEKPGATDVLFGRGGHVNHNPANQRYLELVNQRKEEYHSCIKTEKANIAWDIMRELRRQDPPSRFLKKDYSSGLWRVVADPDVRRKISQCLRERGTPVCPTAKGKQKKKQEEKLEEGTSTPRLRLSLRTSRRAVTVRTYSDEEEWQPDDGDEESSPGAVEEQPSTIHEKAGRPATRLREQQRIAIQKQQEEPVDLLQTNAEEGDVAPVPSSAVEQPVVEEWQQEPQETESEGSGLSNEVFAPPPPMPRPVPLKQEGSNCIWSDFFVRSFASSTPSIFDFSRGGENAWENLLDTAILPDLARSESESLPGSYSTEEQAAHHISVTKRSYSQSSTLSISNPAGWGECISPAKRRKTQPDDSDPESANSFFNTNAPSLGKVLEESQLLSLSTTGAC